MSRGSRDEVGKPVTLKELARHLKLSPATVSVVLNRSPVADSIPKETQDRVFAAARELDYRPNPLARSLRRRRSSFIGVLVPDVREDYAAGVMSIVEEYLQKSGYLCLAASHHSRTDLLEDYLTRLKAQLVEGFVLVASPISEPPGIPTVAVAGHRKLDRVTNVVLDHDRAAALALSHLVDLGHRDIAFFRGRPESADAEARWHAILKAADALAVDVRSELTMQLGGQPDEGRLPPRKAYQEGYEFGRRLVSGGAAFTGLFAFNDGSAIGAMKAFQEAGMRVPEDVSVIGFDDVRNAAFQNPSLTTIRQPLEDMGEVAARILLRRLAGHDAFPSFVTVKPELAVRDSTGPARSGHVRFGGRRFLKKPS